MTRTKVSFSIVSYNNEKKIEKILKNLISLLSSTISYEIIIIDNNSTDSTTKVVEKFEEVNTSVKLISLEKNVGFGKAHNIGFENTDSEYHFIVNPDIIIPNFDCVNRFITYLDTHEDIGMLSPLIKNLDGTVQKLFKKQPTILDLGIRLLASNSFKRRQNWFTNDGQYNKILPIDYASGSFMVFRSSVYRSIEGFDDRFFMYMEDADITRKVNEVSKAVFFPESFVYHEWQRESHKKIKYLIISLSSTIKYFNKWGWRIF